MFPTLVCVDSRCGRRGSVSSKQHARKGKLSGVIQELYPTLTVHAARGRPSLKETIAYGGGHIEAVGSSHADGNTHSSVLEGAGGEVFAYGPALTDRWLSEPGVVRVVHGVPHRVDRIRCLGNAVIPQVAEYIGRLIVEYDGRRLR